MSRTMPCHVEGRGRQCKTLHDCARSGRSHAKHRHEEIEGHVLSGAYGAQELHDLVVDFGRGFVLYPVAHIGDFESSHETRKANTEFFYWGIESRQAIRLPRNVKGRLGDLRAFPSTRQIEIRFGGGSSSGHRESRYAGIQ